MSWEPGEEDVAAVLQARMVKPAWVWRRGAAGKGLAERSPRDGSEGRAQNLTWVLGTGGEQRGAGTEVDNTTVVDLVRMRGLWAVPGVMPKELLKM